MAYQYTLSETSNDRNRQQQQQRNNHSTTATLPPFRRRSGRRSRPISIPGQTHECEVLSGNDSSSSSSCSDDNTMLLANGAAAHSVPSRLLLAPRLGSKTTPIDYDNTVMPPDLFLSDRTDYRPPLMTSYGSLRERQSAVYPASYSNDRRVEHLKSRRPHGLSVAERIQTRKLQQEQQQPPSPASSSATNTTTGMSSLTAMMHQVQDTNDNDAFGFKKKQPHPQLLTSDTMSTVTDRDSCGPQQQPPLSTSLTGLELLRHGWHSSPHTRRAGTGTLARSLSEPVPQANTNHNNNNSSPPSLSVLRHADSLLLPPPTRRHWDAHHGDNDVDTMQWELE